MTSPPLVTPSPVAVRLGYLALVPFVAGAVLIWLDRPAIAYALSVYAAVVIAFIGAIHWGMAFTSSRPSGRAYVWGVVPSLVAWVTVLTPPRTALAVHAVTLVVCYLVDRATYHDSGASLYLPLRLRLTIVATVCCIAGAAGA